MFLFFFLFFSFLGGGGGFQLRADDTSLFVTFPNWVNSDSLHLNVGKYLIFEFTFDEPTMEKIAKYFMNSYFIYWFWLT